MNNKPHLLFITTISISISIFLFYICGFLYDNQIVFSNQFVLTFHYFDIVQKLILSIAILDPVLYCIFIYILPKHYQETHSVKETIIYAIIGKEKAIGILILWIVMFVCLIVSYYSNTAIANYMGIISAYTIPLLGFFTSFFIMVKFNI